MDPRLRGDRVTFGSQGPRSNPYRMMVWGGLIVVGIWLLFQIQVGSVPTLFQPTPTPTRTVSSYLQEARSLWDAGKLISGPEDVDALEAYQEALRLTPDDPSLLAEIARAQTYSSALLSTDLESQDRLLEAKATIERAEAVAPNNSEVFAIKALVFDWLATNPLTTAEDRELHLATAQEAAVRAINLDQQNILALTFYAEVLLDQQNWLQAQQTIEEAIARNPDLMDTRRVYATVLESLGQYRLSIEWYEKALELNPNLTFLYIRIGITFRELGVYDQALEFFAQAASINEQIGVKDPTPYIGIAKTYAQQGEFFIAARNAERALEFDATNPNTYGQLGDIYVRSRNFEGALPALQCSVVGCTAEENEVGGVDVIGQPLTSSTMFYYLRYGSVLAALNDCERAMPILETTLAEFPDDPTAQGVVQENRVICQNLQVTNP